MTDTDVMTVREVAECLKVKDRTVYRLVADRRISGFKVGASRRFRKCKIDRWTEANSVGLGDPGEQVERKR